MKIRLQQLNPKIGDIKGNTELILTVLRQAEEDGMDLLILPELCVCGYSPMDLLERAHFRHSIYEANEQIVEATHTTALIFGTATESQNKYGRPCFNTALMAEKGEHLAEIHKCLLPTYDVYDELRYFEPGDTAAPVKWRGKKLGITVCEDIWGNNSAVQYHTYAVDPVKEVREQGADVIINISGSPFTVSKSDDRLRMLKKNADNVERPILYVNQVGANTELIADGDSTVLNEKGEVVARAPLFEEAILDLTLDDAITARGEGAVAPQLPYEERIFRALRCGLQDYFKKTGITSKVVLGLSGGIDSSLVASIATEALGAENVLGIGMPSEFSSEGSITDAEQLAENLGIEMHDLPIRSLYDEYNKVLHPLFENTEFGVAEENLQSRARGVLLMAIANKFNRFVLNTGNKSEMATGYCTLYGDMNGALAVISDLYKTEVYAVSRWLNKSYYQQEVIPQAVLEKPPSAELRPNQKDIDSLPEYDKLDTILKLYIEKQWSASEISNQGFDRQLVERIINLVDANEHKRYQAPPGLKIHDKAFGSGRRWPLVHGWTKNGFTKP